MAPSIYIDNASTTPPFISMIEEITKFAPMYANVNGRQYEKATYTEQLFEDARNIILSFLNADHSKDTVLLDINI